MLPVERARASWLAVATVVAAGLLTACGADGETGTGQATVSVTGTDELSFEPADLTASAGTITVELTAEDAVEHTFVVEELGDRQVVAAEPGTTSTGTIELDAGSYTFYCDVPGHRQAGMQGTLTVE